MSESIVITKLFSLSRAVVLRFVSLGVLLFTLWDQITCKGKINDLKCMLCGYNYESYPVIYSFCAAELMLLISNTPKNLQELVQKPIKTK